tara:strand:+ start:3415 stop:3660 length:246 start_codon:yes stop_codon:yes gene_type:complete
MNNDEITIKWPNGKYSIETLGEDWLIAAEKAGFKIPIGCMGGSCGACEIEVNGEVIRACISKVRKSKLKTLEVDLFEDQYW